MSIVAMKKVTFSCEDHVREQLIDLLNNLDGFYPSTKRELEGFVKASEVDNVLSFVKLDSVSSVVVDPKKTDDEYPPVFLKKNFFTEPFAEFVEKHALPGYFDIDHTLLFALSFCVLFGIMFGDIGQGIVLVLIGLFIHKKKSTTIFARVGIFSIIFGWLYGSIFGNEEAIPEWMEHHHFKYFRFGLLERENTINLLLMVMALGATFILVAMIMNIIDKVDEGKIKKALLANNGVAGLLMYGSFAGFAISMFYIEKGELLETVFAICALVSAVVIFFYGYDKNSKSLKGKELILKALGYLWHTVLEFASSTMSFLMVGCFALAHATLMMVVYHLAESVGPLSIVVIILGNALVMGIEATEVWHQCLKLEHDVLYKFIEE